MRWANRRQVEFRACAWNDLLPDDHQARIVWNFVEGLDVSPLLERIQSVVGEAGRSAIAGSAAATGSLLAAGSEASSVPPPQADRASAASANAAMVSPVNRRIVSSPSRLACGIVGRSERAAPRIAASAIGCR